MNDVTDIYDLLMEGGDISGIVEAPREDGRKLGNHEPGDTVTIGGRQYIVLEHTDDWTAVITKDFATQMSFGDSADYSLSEIREWCNGEFYNELVSAVGRDDILKHTIDLTADDGTGKRTIEDYVSILTTNRYRKYREFLPRYGRWWWTATRVTEDDSDYARNVCYVRSDGVVGWRHSGCDDGGVRPFCFLKSSIFVD